MLEINLYTDGCLTRCLSEKMITERQHFAPYIFDFLPQKDTDEFKNRGLINNPNEGDKRFHNGVRRRIEGKFAIVSARI